MADITRSKENRDQAGQSPQPDKFDSIRLAAPALTAADSKGANPISTDADGRQYLAFVQEGKAATQPEKNNQETPARGDEQQGINQQGRIKISDFAKEIGRKLDGGFIDSLDLARLKRKYEKFGQDDEDDLVQQIQEYQKARGSKSKFAVVTVPDGNTVTKSYELTDEDGKTKKLFLANFDENRKEVEPDYFIASKLLDGMGHEAVIKANLEAVYRYSAATAYDGTLSLGELFESSFRKRINAKLQKLHNEKPNTPDLELLQAATTKPSPPYYSYDLKDRNTGITSTLINDLNLDPEHRDKDAKWIRHYAQEFSEGAPSEETKQEFSNALLAAYRLYKEAGVTNQIRRQMSEELKTLKHEHPDQEGFKLVGGVTIGKGVGDKAGQQVPSITANYDLYNQAGERVNIIRNLDLSPQPVDDAPAPPENAKGKKTPEFS